MPSTGPTTVPVPSRGGQLAAMYLGGPQPLYGSVRPDTAEHMPKHGVRKLTPKEDKEWKALVRCGGAGDQADTPEQQRARYTTADQDSYEINPGLSKHCLRKRPDLIVVGGLDYTIRTYDPNRNFKLVQIFEHHTGAVNCVESYRGDYIVSGADDMTVRLFKHGEEGTPGELVLTIWISKYPVRAIAPLPGHRCALGGLDKAVRIVSLATGATLHKLTGHLDEGFDNNFMQKEGCGALYCFLHLRGNLLASGSDDSTIRFWDIDTGKCFGKYLGHKGYGADIGNDYRTYKLSTEFAPVWRMCHLGGDGSKIASCSYDRTVCIWDVSDIEQVRIVFSWQAGDNAILHLAVLSETVIGTCGADKEVKFWTWEDGELLDKTGTRGHANSMLMLDETTVAIGGGDSTLRLFDWEKGEDLMGDRGFYAMEYIIQCTCRVFRDDADEAKLIRRPILYQRTPAHVAEADSKEALVIQKYFWDEAIKFVELWDTSSS